MKVLSRTERTGARSDSGTVASGERASQALRPPTLPAIVSGRVWHARTAPLRRRFEHRLYQWLVDLDDIPLQPWYLRPLASFRAADHIGDPSSDIKSNVVSFLAAEGLSLSAPRILMLCNATVLGYVFDPLTVYWCFEGNTLACVVAEVHNTYGERHAYLLREAAAATRSGETMTHTEKALYVSPFFDVTGSYDLRFVLSPERVGATVTLHRQGRAVFAAGFSGSPRPASPRHVLRTALTHPLMTQRVSALIRAHGIVLWLRRLPVAPRPQHSPQKGTS